MTNKNDFQFDVLSNGDDHFGIDSSRLYNELQTMVNDARNNDKLALINIDGDLYHRVIDLNEEDAIFVDRFVNELLQLCKENNIQLRIIRGTRSHDFNQLNTLKKYQSIYPFFKIYEKATVEDIPLYRIDPSGKLKLKVLYLPEEYPTDERKYYDKLIHSVPENTYDMINGHGMIDFVAFTGYKSDFEQNMRTAVVFDSDELCKICAGPINFGHIHNWNVYKDKIYYTTSYTRYSFGDKGKKGYLLNHFTFDKDSYKIKSWSVERKVNELAPTYITADLDQEDLDTADKKLAYIAMLKKNYDNVRIKTTNKTDKAILHKITETDPTIKVTYQNKEDTTENKLKSEYQFLLDNKDPKDIPSNIQKYIELDHQHNPDIDLGIDDHIPTGIIEAMISPDTEVKDVSKVISKTLDKEKNDN